MKYVIRFRLSIKGKNDHEGRIPGLAFDNLPDAQREADKLNDGAGPHLQYWPEEVREWEKQGA